MQLDVSLRSRNHIPYQRSDTALSSSLNQALLERFQHEPQSKERLDVKERRPSIEPSNPDARGFFATAAGAQEHITHWSRETLDIWDHAALLFHAYDWESAVQYFARLAAFATNSAVKAIFLVNMGIIRCHLGEYCLASGLFSRALVIEPNLAIAHFLLGVANCELETYDVALTAFTACAAVLSQSAYVADYRMMDLDFVLKYDKAVANIQITASEVAHKNEYPHSTNGHLLHRLPAGLIFESPSERRWTFLINSRRRKDLAIPSRASKRSKRLTSQERDRPLPPVPINAISGGDTKRPDAGAALKARHKLSRSCGKNEILPQKVNRDSPGLPDRLKGLVQFVKHVAPGHKRALSEAQSTGHTIRDGTSSLTTPKPPSLRFSSDEHTVPEEEHKIGAQSGAEDTIPFGSLYGRWSSTSSVYSRPVDSMYPSKPLFAYRAPQVSEISGSETEPFLTMRFTPGPEGSTSEIQEGEATAKILREYLSDSSTRSPHCLPHLSDQDEKNLIRSLLPEQEREEEEEVEEEAYNPMREYFARLSTPGSTNASIFNGLSTPRRRSLAVKETLKLLEGRDPQHAFLKKKKKKNPTRTHMQKELPALPKQTRAEASRAELAARVLAVPGAAAARKATQGAVVQGIEAEKAKLLETRPENAGVDVRGIGDGKEAVMKDVRSMASSMIFRLGGTN